MKQELLDKYNVPVPRYTSYPPANYFHDGFTSRDMRMPSVNPTASSRNRFPSIFIFLSANVSAIIADAIPTPLPSLKS